MARIRLRIFPTIVVVGLYLVAVADIGCFDCSAVIVITTLYMQLVVEGN
jgi:hypothetical protein